MNQKHLKAAVEFGKQLIKTQDLDPVYTVLWQVQLNVQQLQRLVLAYSCLYHLGASAYLSEYEGKEFFRLLTEAAMNHNRNWPRGTERRHWRGANAINTAKKWRNLYLRPEHILNYWFEFQGFRLISERVQETPSFGPWIAWKIADMGERVLGYRVNFLESQLGIYRGPRQGAALLLHGDKLAQLSATEMNLVLDGLAKKLFQFLAPPRWDRAVNVQEFETILCKYKSHCNGHYEIGKDSKEVLHALQDPHWGKTATKLRQAAEKLECVA